MYTVERYAGVRHCVFVEGRSRRGAARVFGVSRDTLDTMCRVTEPQGYQRKKPPPKPKPDPFVPGLHAILAADQHAPSVRLPTQV